MIDLDFLIAHMHATIALKDNHYWHSNDVPLTLKSWDDYAAIIAPEVKPAVWGTILGGVGAIWHLNVYRKIDAAHAGADADLPLITDRCKPAVEPEAHNLWQARLALAPLHSASEIKWMAQCLRDAGWEAKNEGRGAR